MNKCKGWFFGICLVLAVPLTLTTFSACAHPENVRTLETLVAEGAIGEETLQNIAALRVGSLQTVRENEQGETERETVPYTPTPVGEGLPKDRASALLQDFDAFIEERFQSAHVDCKVVESGIVDYFGTYGGRVVVEIRFSLSGLTLADEERDLIVSGYYLGEIGGDSLIVGWSE